jgi:isopentenyl diphosphate isomerase/L-lactate dehydrogenase-like FMN-dependent dehydrogenase
MLQPNGAAAAALPDSIPEFQARFRERVDPASVVFISSAVDDEITMRRNVAAFSWVRVRADADSAIPPAHVDPSITLLGQRMEFPILVAPMSGQSSVDPDRVGDATTYTGATAARTTMLLSHFAAPYAAVAPAARGRLIAQFFPEVLDAAIQAALTAGTPAIVLTVDTPYNPHMERSRRPAARNWKGEIRARLELWRAVVQNQPTNGDIQERQRYRLSPRSPAPVWNVVDRIRAISKAPILLKGIQSPVDARMAVERGIDGIIVSNHGGRVLDHCESTLESLPAVADAVAGRIPVLLDSGVRSGQDVFKAIALGADAVLVGRPVLWGLASGAAGVQRVLEILQAGLVATMAQTGCRTIGHVSKDHVEVNFP